MGQTAGEFQTGFNCKVTHKVTQNLHSVSLISYHKDSLKLIMFPLSGNVIPLYNNTVIIDNVFQMYEQGWKKQLSYVIAFSKDEVVDVSYRLV